jgi:pantothenate kinase-related protein Tda10
MSQTRGQSVLDQFRDGARPDVILAACDVKFADITESKEGDIEIEGWFITEQLIESRLMIVRTDAFDHPDGFKMFNGRVLAFHDQLKEPVGEVTKMGLVKNKGIRGTVRVWRENSELFTRAIREGTL